MKKFLTYAGTTLGLTAALVLGGGMAASAHDCFNPNRSDQGNAAAGKNSQSWWTLVVEDVVMEGVGMGYTQEQAECILDEYDGPASFTVKVKGANGQDGTLLAHNPNDHLDSDGKGIDLVFSAYGDEIMGAYMACGVEFG
ncbi:hypothetical protein [Microbacterium esteraromaticum]|uniref:hypothetical protein n=1 Tax=Microbacterium esteraromaticum TaxID=57043 RepID=UPI0019571C9B|nr:hypothetical protein [Microbacterium esteraromaticum]MBM7466549.1 hypothetical protein [Microbacterium esteraromaticum]